MQIDLISLHSPYNNFILLQIREEALQRELYSTRLALVRKIPPCLLNQHIIEDSVSCEQFNRGGCT